MEQSLFHDKYPVFSKTIAKSDTQYQTVDAILNYLEDCINRNEKAVYIARFDHATHTKNINGEVAPEIQEAKHIIFCFGMKLPVPQAMAVRPRSIGVTDMGDNFVVSFMEAPNPKAQEWMTEWVEAI